MADNTSKYKCIDDTVEVQKSNSYTVSGCSKTNIHRMNTHKIVNNRKMHSMTDSVKSNISNKGRIYNSKKT